MVCQWDRYPLTSVTSLKNLEMSQRSSDVPMLVNFLYIYFSHIFTELGGIVYIIFRGKTLTFHRLPLKSETFKNPNCQNQLMFLQGV